MIYWSLICKGEKKKLRNVDLVIFLEIKYKMALRMVTILDMPAEKTQGHNLVRRVFPTRSSR